MSFVGFGYVIATNPAVVPADGAFTRLYWEPTKMPLFLPDGIPYKAGDGSYIYVNKPKLTIVFAGLTFNVTPEGAPSSTGGVLQLMTDWRTARDQYKQQFWINRWNPIDYTWIKQLAVMLRPDLANKYDGKAYVNLAIEFEALGYNVANATGGELNPPTYSYSGDVLLDPYVGGYGRGLYGKGGYSIGSLT